MGNTKQFLSSRVFFYLILVGFSIETVWLSVVNRIPMAFDEGFHFGLIQFFSKHLANPFITAQGPETYQYGAIVHNPSFLYHYLLAFPYTLVSYFTDDVRIQVVSLRLLNVAFAIASLVLIHKALQRFGVHRALASVTVLLFAFTPIYSVLSAQLNYDNLLGLATAGTVYLMTRVWNDVSERRQISASLLFGLIAVSAWGSMVKFAYVPVAVGVAMLVVWLIIRNWAHRRELLLSLTGSFAGLSAGVRVALVTVTIAGLGVFGAYYGYNAVRYHNPVPQCHQVLGVAACTHYYAWNRNYELSRQPQTPRTMNIVSYSYFWAKVSYYQLFAAIIPTGGLVYIAKTFYIGATVILAFAVAAAFLKISFIYKYYRPLCVIAVLLAAYVLALWSRNFHDYQQLGQPVAIQGRYLLPVLAYVYGFLILGVWHLLQSERKAVYGFRTAIGAVTVFMFLYFGGFVRYISQVSPDFGWTHDTTIVGSTARK